MFHVFNLDVTITIQVCFNSILHMLQRSNGCCRGDDTLGQGKGVAETARGGGRGARRGWRHWEGRSAVRQGRSVAWRGKECSGLDTGGATGMGMGIESRTVGRSH